jgi:hypothetical protein
VCRADVGDRRRQTLGVFVDHGVDERTGCEASDRKRRVGTDAPQNPRRLYCGTPLTPDGNPLETVRCPTLDTRPVTVSTAALLYDLRPGFVDPVFQLLRTLRVRTETSVFGRVGHVSVRYLKPGI